MPRETLTGLNPAVLIWARQRSGLEREEVAQTLQRPVEEIVLWEEGKATPTYPQLESLAYKVYKRPLALFFFPSPPAEPSAKRSFRTLPDPVLEQLSAGIRYLIRDGLAKQEALVELTGPKNPVSSPIFRETRLTPEADVAVAASTTREQLGITLSDQRAFLDTRDALGRWRSAIEDRGIYVFKNSFGSQDVSGFCLYHPEFPIIYINNNSSMTRQIFTLIHELAHILLTTGGITKADTTYIRTLRGRDFRIEVFCNQFAGELLMPSSDVNSLLKRTTMDAKNIEEIARTYRVSREVVLRRALDLNLISKTAYEKKVAKWNEEYLKHRKASRGGNYYATQATYLGPSYLGLAFSRFYDGSISREQLADYLGIRVTSIAGLEDRFLRSVAG